MTKLSERRKALKTSQPKHVIIVARAGTGKTTTLVEGLRSIKGEKTSIQPSPQQEAIWNELRLSSGAQKICFAAFNKSIATELTKRVPQGIEAMTMHSMGYKAVRNRWKLRAKDPIEGNRTNLILEEITGKSWRDIDSVVLAAVNKLVGLAKANLLTNPNRDMFVDLAAQYDIELNESEQVICEYSAQVLQISKDSVERHGMIDFNDMIWLPIVHDLSLPQYDLLLVDEAQDLNRCQQELALRSGKRLILCGDPAQAIYGFAGADSGSMPNMMKRLEATPNGCVELKLNVTRRCGRAIVKEANQFVPDFEAHESNAEGRISRCLLNGLNKPSEPKPEVNGQFLPGHDPKTWHYRTFCKPGDMILCRVNAPLVSECFKLLKMGKKAVIQGKDIGQGLVNQINKFNAKSLTELSEKLNAWYEKEVAKENAKKFPSDVRLQSLADRKDCLDFFIEEATSVDQLIAKVYSIFTDTDQSGILLSSIHKAKGLEAERVFLVDPPTVPFPHPMAKSPEARTQEYNLRYVAVTRAKSHLVYVA